MPLIWVTGISGAGKSTVVDELRRRGYRAFDADRDGLSQWVDRETGVAVASPAPEQRPAGWVARHAWLIDVGRVRELRALAGEEPVFLCGAVENERDAWELFDRVVCLVVDDATVIRRLAERSTNDFGKSDEERNLVLGLIASTETIYRALGATIINATAPLHRVVDQVLAAGIATVP